MKSGKVESVSCFILQFLSSNYIHFHKFKSTSLMTDGRRNQHLIIPPLSPYGLNAYITNRQHCMRARFGHRNIIVLNVNNQIINPMFCAQNLSYDYRGLVIMHTNQVDYCHRNFDMLFGQLQSPFCHPSSLCFTNGNVKHKCFYYK